MQRFEYKVVAAPRRGEKARGIKTTEDRFALALTNLMNELAADGWEYHRADSLPVDERAGLTGGVRTSFQNMLVFRRELAAKATASATSVATHQAQPAPVAAPAVVAAPAPVAPSAVAAPVPQVTLPGAGADSAPLRLGAADAPVGPAPSIGPASAEKAGKPDVAAE